MKKIRVTLTREGVRVSCVLSYQSTLAPSGEEWSGDREAFPMPHGLLPDFGFPLQRLEGVVAHQAGLCGAAFTIEDLGGEAIVEIR